MPWSRGRAWPSWLPQSYAKAPPKEVDPTEQAMKDFNTAQTNYANKFQEQLPQMQGQMANLLSQNANETMNAQVQQNKSKNTQRGLSYGGIAQGEQAQIKNQVQQNLSNEIAQSNAGLLNASNQLNAQALQTGTGMQGALQAIQNSMWSREMASQQASNAVTGNVMSTGLLAAMMLA